MFLPPEYHPRVLRHVLSRHSWAVSFGLHVATGFLAVAAHYAVMWGLLRAGAEAVPASLVGFLAGAATRYLLSYYRVFAPTGSIPSTLLRFLAALAMQMAANTLMLAYMLDAGLPVWSAQILTTVLLTFANFIVYRLWVFR